MDSRNANGDIADREYLLDAVTRSLALAQRICDRHETLRESWPVDPSSGAGTEFDKYLAEAAIFVLVASRVTEEGPAWRSALHDLGLTLSDLVRSERAQIHLLRSRRYRQLVRLPHAVLSAAGYPDIAFDGLAPMNDELPAVECPAFRVAEHRWLLGLRAESALEIEDLLPVSIFSSGINSFDMTRMDVYAVTHWLMYCSDFGTRPIPAALHAQAVSMIDDALVWQLATEDLDLLGELLMSLTMLRVDWTPACVAAWHVLKTAWDDMGFVPSPGFDATRFRLLTGDAKDAYAMANVYHTQFVFGMLAALLLESQPGMAVTVVPGRGGSPTHEAIDACRRAVTQAAAYLDVRDMVAQPNPGAGAVTLPARSVLSAIASKGERPEQYWLKAVAGMADGVPEGVVLDALLVRSVREYDLDSIAKLVDLAISLPMAASPTLVDTITWLAGQQTPDGALGAHFLGPTNAGRNEAVTVTRLLSDLLARAMTYLAAIDSTSVRRRAATAAGSWR
jgi:hypothetical protein